jgi:tryptophan synthase alpha chain
VVKPMTDQAGSRIHKTFAQTKLENRAAFVGYLPAGYPTREAFLTHATKLLEFADLLEIGLPYSDPLGDGPTIQKASEVAIHGGMTVKGTFEQAAALRERTDKPLCIMTYYNPILSYGEEAFVSSAIAAGVDGLILPDLPPDEADTLIPLAREAGLALTFLLAPTSTTERIKVPTLVANIKAHTDTPVAVGFGVADRATAHGIAAVADGVVVGSALVTTAGKGESLEALSREILLGCQR